MDAGEITRVRHVPGEDLYLIETGMYDVQGYGGVYVLEADRPAIIETGIGTNYEAILDALDEVGIARSAIEVIAVTHVHLDHAGGAGLLARECENAVVAVHEIGAPHLIDPARLIAGTKAAVKDQWRHYTDPAPVPGDRVQELTDGDRIDLHSHTLHAVHAPGHAPHQVIYSAPSLNAVFTGDAAGIWVEPRGRVYQTTPPPNFDLEQAVADIETIRDIDPETLLFTHFGPARHPQSRLDQYEDTLMSWIERVDRASTEFETEAAVINHFTARTDLEDVWSPEKARAETAINVRGALTYLDGRDRS